MSGDVLEARVRYLIIIAYEWCWLERGKRDAVDYI